MTYSTPQTRRKKIFISFDFHHDRQYRYLLAALNKNTSSALIFYDFTPSEVQSNDIGRIKAALASKLDNADISLVVIGKYANTPHLDRANIGTVNWQWWEIEKAKALKKKLVGVKVERTNPTPTPLLNSNAKWAYSFSVQAIVNAIANV